jgi:aryl-alcohol dehydrogenase-like predicted oxidoreductase
MASPVQSRSRTPITSFNWLGRYEKGNSPKAISIYIALARKHGLDPAQMAIAFSVSRPFVTSAIIGATTMDQLKTDIAAAHPSRA